MVASTAEVTGTSMRQTRSTPTTPTALRAVVLSMSLLVAGTSTYAAGPQPDSRPPGPQKVDRTGKKQVGKASFYAHRFAGRKMADGKPMNPRGDNAASRTLPLGTKAKVTNLETGRSANVTIQDRGPYVKGRIVDLSPATAEQIGLTRDQGIAVVEVAPTQLPEP